MGLMRVCRLLSSLKMPSTWATSASVRTTVESARPPNSRLTASIMMDLPAPVSPVNTLKPGIKRKRKSSMIAKFLITSSFSKVHL